MRKMTPFVSTTQHWRSALLTATLQNRQSGNPVEGMPSQSCACSQSHRTFDLRSPPAFTHFAKGYDNVHSVNVRCCLPRKTTFFEKYPLRL